MLCVIFNYKDSYYTIVQYLFKNNFNMKKMDDNKNIIIFILVIFVLFFISNDKNYNKIFHKNIIKIYLIFHSLF